MSFAKSDKLGSMSIGKLLLQMSLPAVFSMLIQSLYNIVDSIYVAQLGQDALFALGLAFPMQMFSLAIAIGCGVGTNALVARRLGQKRKDHANQTATTGLILAVIHSLIILVIGVFFAKPFLSLFSDSPEIIKMGSDYLQIALAFSLGQQVQLVCERILQSTGNMIIPMFSLLISAVTNIILDPIFIFGYFGVPAMGVSGAAIATVIGQWTGMAFILFIIFNKDHDVVISLKNFKFEKIVVSKIYKIGIPTMIMNAIGSVTISLMYGILVVFSDVAVNVLNIYFKAQSFIFMPVFGMTQGAMPILSYNYGSQNRPRFDRTIRLMIISSISIMTIGVLIFMIAPELILSMFNPTPELIDVGSIALRILSMCFIFAAINIVAINVLQSIGYSIYSMTLTVLRQIAILVPSAYILGHLFGLDAVWWCYPIAEFLVMIIFVPITLKTVNKCFKKAE